MRTSLLHVRHSADIRDSELLASLPDSVDSVVHLAARAGVRPSIEDPGLYVDVNLAGTSRLLDFAVARPLNTPRARSPVA